jgi:glycosyltransferase involved in cell wall biosynthesis
VAPEKIHDTPNWIDDGHLQPDAVPSAALRESLGLPSGRLFMFAGNLGELQGLGPLVEAFARCPTAQLVFVGDGVAKPELQRISGELRLRNVHFVPPQDTSHIGRYIAASDIQIVSLKDTPLLRATMPSKVQASLAAARPVLAHAPGDVAELARSSGAGLSAPPGDVEATAAAIRQFCAADPGELRDRGRAARRCYDERFSPTAGAARLEDMLATAIDGARGPNRRKPRQPMGVPA